MTDPLAAARTLTRLLDTAVRVPGTRARVGLDPLLGLVPGLGDLVGAALSGYMVLQARELGAPSAVVARMVANVAIDTAVGAIPVLGDLFDAGWKANSRNLALLEGVVAQPATTRRASVLVVAGALVGLVALAAVGIVLALYLVRQVVELLNR